LARKDIKKEVLELKQKTVKVTLVRSPGLIVTLTQLSLIDEYQPGVQLTIASNGLQLFKTISERIGLKLLKQKHLGVVQ